MIRLAERKDIDEIMEVFDKAKKYMRQNGNHAQWVNGYPDKELMLSDIANEYAYVYVEDGKVHGAFSFIIGEDPTYLEIEGDWKNSEEYGTIHRIGSDGEKKGVFVQCLDYCKEQIDNLRIDTHADNTTMKYIVPKNGFEYCGIIYVSDGTPRLAYHYVK